MYRRMNPKQLEKVIEDLKKERAAEEAKKLEKQQFRADLENVTEDPSQIGPRIQLEAH